MDVYKRLNIYLLSYIIALQLGNCSPLSTSVTASLTQGGYKESLGGGSVHDTQWIDLMSVMEIAATEPELSELRKLYDRTEMGFKLEQSRHITVFMPNNAAIEKELKPYFPYLKYEQLIHILQLHVIPEVIKMSELDTMRSIRIATLSNDDLLISKLDRSRNSFTLNADPDDSSSETLTVHARELENANGVAFIIDRLILTPSLKNLLKNLKSSYTPSSSLFDVPNYVQTTNQHHWQYGRFDNQPHLQSTVTKISTVPVSSYNEIPSRQNIRRGIIV